MSSKPILTLYRGSDEPNSFVWSPFVTKVEFRVRTSSTPYTCASGSTTSGPKGKIPYLGIKPSASAPEDFIADSSLIIKDLVELGELADLNSQISPQQKAYDLSLRAMLEDKLYFYHSHERWIRNYYPMRNHILAHLPFPMRYIIGIVIHRATYQGLQKQGTGRFTDAEIAAFRLEIWGAFNDLLVESRRKMRERGGGKEEGLFWVLGGEEPTEVDACLFGFVVSVLMCEAAPESRAVLRGFPVVVEWAEGVRERWFPDYEMWP